MATDLERIDQLLAGQEATVRRAFLEFVKLVQSPAVMELIATRLEAGDLAGAFAIVESYIVQMADVLPRIQQQVGDATATEIAPLLPASIVAAIGFDASYPRAAELVRTQRLGLIRELSDSQLRAIQQAINRALNAGLGAQATALAFRDSIGLTASQEAAVASYRDLLERASRDALQRALRDRRFDGRVLQAVEENRPLTENQIDMMVSRYRARALALRAETIARSEAGRAVAEAREEATIQMVERTGLDPNRVRRIWNATGDERTRLWHESMDGQAVAMDESFTDGLGNQLRYPHDPLAPPETTINCRCVLTLEIADPPR